MSDTLYYVGGAAVVLGGGYLLYDYLKTDSANGNSRNSLATRAVNSVVGAVSQRRIPNPILRSTRTTWFADASSGQNFYDDISNIFSDDRAVPCIVALASVESMTGDLVEVCYNNNPFNFHAYNQTVTVARVGNEYIRAFGTGYDRALVRACLNELKDNILRPETITAATAGEIDTFQYCLGKQNWSETMRNSMDLNSPGRVNDNFLWRKLVRMRDAGMIDDRYLSIVRR